MQDNGITFTKGNFGENTFTGTVKQFTSAGVTINGKQLNGVEISILKGLNIFREVGKAPKDTKRKGKPETIYSITSSKAVKVQFGD